MSFFAILGVCKIAMLERCYKGKNIVYIIQVFYNT